MLPHEAIALFRYLQSRMAPDKADRVRMKIRHYAQSGEVSGHAVARRPCAFLIDGECSAYEVRPSACAAYHSVSKQRCEQSFHESHRYPPARWRWRRSWSSRWLWRKVSMWRCRLRA